MTPNGCLTFVLRVVGILLALGVFTYLYLAEEGII